jgi:hypothetical protein
MAFLRSALQAVGGFDVQFRVAGDDVDMCWRLQEHGWKLGFNPAAQVWHHRRNSLRAYWLQQTGYGKSEALLEKKWSKKYNSVGHLTWRGRVYGPGGPGILRTTSRIYYGQWGSAPFQSLYEPRLGCVQSLFLMPEWHLANLVLALLSVLGIHWRPLLLAVPLLAVSVGIPIVHAWVAAARSRFQGPDTHFALKVLMAYLHMFQPAARLYGRLGYGLKFWRSRVPAGFVVPVQKKLAVWTEKWRAPEARLQSIEADLLSRGAPVQRGGEYDDWDLEVQGGFWGGARLLMAVEDHGAGNQYVRCRVRPKYSTGGLILSSMLTFLSAGAGLDGAWPICLLLGVGALASVYQTIRNCGGACAVILQAISVDGLQAAEQKMAS